MAGIGRCPECFKARHATKYFICPNGHTICGACLTQHHNCPHCGVPFGDNPVRNLMVEQTIAEDRNIVANCVMSGCDFEGTRAQINSHLYVCNKADEMIIHCPWMSCESTVRKCDMESHVMREHEIQSIETGTGQVEDSEGVYNTTLSLNFEQGHQRICLYQFDGEKFYFLWWIDSNFQKQKSVYIALFFPGPDIAAKRYKIDIHMKGPTASIQWTCPVLSLTKPLYNMKSKSECFYLPFDMMYRLNNGENEIDALCKIRRVIADIGILPKITTKSVKSQTKKK